MENSFNDLDNDLAIINFHFMMAEYYFNRWMYYVDLPLDWDDVLLGEAMEYRKKSEEHRNLAWE